MRRVFVDTSAFFAHLVTEDAHHAERVRPLDEARAIELLKQHADKKYSFCDALSFVVMDQLGVSEALSFDRDFRGYGKFVLLSSPP